MAVCMFGYQNRIVSGTVASGSEVAGLGAGNLQTQQGNDAAAWRTAGVLASASGAWLTIDAGAAVTWRAFALAQTNLTSAATVRWRVGPAAAVIEEAPAQEIVWTSETNWVAPTGWSFARGSIGTRNNAAGLVETVASGAMRWDYDPVTLAIRGVLVEPLTTNLWLQSADMTQAANVKTNATVTANATTAPDGTATAGKVLETVAAGNHTISQAVTGTAATQAFACYLKPAERTKASIEIAGTISAVASAATVLVDLAAGSAAAPVVSGNLTAAVARVEPRADGWFRVSIVATASAAATLTARLYLADATGAISYTGVASSGLFAWGMQVEAQPVATSYIPTGAATVARANDVPRLALGSWWNDAAGSAVMEYYDPLVVPINVNRGIWTASDNTGNNRILSFIAPALAQTAGRITIAGTGTATSGNVLNHVANSNNRAAQAWSVAAGYITTENAATPSSVTASAIPAASLLTDGVRFGGFSNAGAMFGHLRRWRYYAKRLTDGQVRGLAASASSTLDATAALYDSGSIAGGVAPGFRQSVLVAPADVSAQYARVDLDDAANPDGFLSVALAYAGPVWQPSISFSIDTGLSATRAGDVTRTRGGGTYVVPRYFERAWNLSHDAIKVADLWASLVPMLIVAQDGTNVLFVPDPASSYLSRETVFGFLDSTSDIGFRTLAGDWRAWRGRIAERL